MIITPVKVNNGFTVFGYDVTTVIVSHVDGDADQCTVCNLFGRFIDCTVYGVTPDDETSARDCCLHCVPDVVKGLDALSPVRVELSMVAVSATWSSDDQRFDAHRARGIVEPPRGATEDLDAETFSEFNDRMAHPDDNRPHPDAV